MRLISEDPARLHSTLIIVENARKVGFIHVFVFLAGVIDEDYRGNVGVVLFNHSDQDFKIQKGDRVAQLICERIFHPVLKEIQVVFRIP